MPVNFIKNDGNIEIEDNSNKRGTRSIKDGGDLWASFSPPDFEAGANTNKTIDDWGYVPEAEGDPYDPTGVGYETGDDTDKYIGVKQWDVRDIACAVSGVTVDDFVSFEYNNQRAISHIMSIREAVGYNLGATQPTFGIHMRSTSATIASLMKIKEEDRLIDVVLTAPSIMVTCFAGILGNIPLGPIGPEAPEITASGLALRIAEYAERNRWIIQAGSLMANQNNLYNSAGGLTNSLAVNTDWPWQRRRHMFYYGGSPNTSGPGGGWENAIDWSGNSGNDNS